jgi:hypothetical protein
VKTTLPAASARLICRVLGVARSVLYHHQAAASSKPRSLDERTLVTRIKELIEQHPT